ncbi:hypothetical protein WELLINGTON_253 [Erwinia phage Wellington]|uniref:CYTH domain-containing protein n=1 Tax=Erwinia phage Wellington TaxID=2267653 RepID=A0A345BLQ8_9CAUD|nr:hypothetical protein HOT70_gp048 [Erwinia phage Wellington]AXF51379.1 hypothetical protein WELLINGTON_253 [Erwinia phage Wellington]
MSRLGNILAGMERDKEEGILKVARESVSVEKEREYCMWVRPTEEGWAWLQAQAGEYHLDVMMPMLGGRRRVRVHADKAELTVKTFQGQEREEENSDIGMKSALSFYGDEFLTHLVKRVTIDPTDEVKASGGKHWDIDVFYVSQGHPEIPDVDALKALFETVAQGTSFGDWVKVELEVERFEMESIADVIPFAVAEAVPSKPSSPDLQEFLRNYWDNETRL